MTLSDPRAASTTSRPTRREVCALLAIAACGTALRFGHLSAAAVEHFDEGVYASNLWFTADEGFEYPDRHLYAPPLVPWLIEWSMVLFGPGHLGTLLPSLLAGSATLPLIWWVARSWFGPAAGLAAATLAATSDVHLLYSRAALTDVLLCFWMLCAVFCIWKSMTSRATWIWPAGVATGVAWWTKYNGWLPLAIGLSALIPWIWLSDGSPPEPTAAPRSKRRQRGQGAKQDEALDGASVAVPAATAVRRWIAIAVIAGAVWCPVLVDLSSRGGYGAVAANHSRYVVGIAGWWDSLRQQIESHQFLSGMLSCLGVGLAFLVSAGGWRKDKSSFTWNRTSSGASASAGEVASLSARDGGSLAWLPTIESVGLAILLAGASSLIGTSSVLAFLAAVGIAWQMGACWRHRSSIDRNAATALGAWLVAAWFAGMLLSTPLYRPYPRLTLPWLMAAWLGVAALVGRWDAWIIARRDHAGVVHSSRRSFGWWGSGLATVAGLSCWALSGRELVSKQIPGWQSRTGLERAATSLAADAARSAGEQHRDPTVPADFVIYVYGEPALFFHLSRIADAQDNFAVQPASNLGFERLPIPTYLVTGPHAERSETFQEQWAQSADRFQPVGAYADEASSLVLLDNYPASRLIDPDQRPVQRVFIYRVE